MVMHSDMKDSPQTARLTARMRSVGVVCLVCVLAGETGCQQLSDQDPVACAPPEAGDGDIVRLRWRGIRPWATVVLKGGQELETLGFQPQDEEYTLRLPPHEAWTLTFVGGGEGLTADSLSRLCPELRRIEASGLSITGCWRLDDRFLEAIAGVGSLERLTFSDIDGIFRRAESDSPVTLSGLQALARMPNLQCLLLDNFRHLTDSELAMGVNGLERLTALRLSDCWGVGAKTLGAIGSFENLNFLSLRATGVTDGDLRPLEGKTELQVLDLAHCCNLTGRFIEHIKSASRLHTLDLSHCRSMEAMVLEKLCDFQKLRHLDLGGLRGITKERLTALSCLPALEALVLTDCREVDDSTLQYLTRIESLQEIRVQGTSVTDAGVRSFCRQRPYCEVRTRYEVFWASPYDPLLSLDRE